MERYVHPKQRYVPDYIALAGIPARVRAHRIATSTAAEKAALLGWPQRRIVKTLYPSRNGRYVGIVAPGDARIDIKRLVAGALGISLSKACRWRLDGTPEGMRHGTCTPLPRTDAFGTIEALVYLDGIAQDEIVDISLGEHERMDGRRISLQLPHGALAPIIRSAGYAPIFTADTDGTVTEWRGYSTTPSSNRYASASSRSHARVR